jgi:AcrR family transcriptional regulator
VLVKGPNDPRIHNEKKMAASPNQKTDKSGIDRILEAARYEFCRAGLAGAKLDLIAMEAGVSKQLIHHYFRTKGELYQAVVDDISSQAIYTCLAIDYESVDPEKAITLFLHQVFDLFTQWSYLSGLFNDQALNKGEQIPECRDLVSRSPELMQRLENVLKRGQESGIFKADLEPKETFAAAMMVTIGCFTNGTILSALIDLDFTDPVNLERWREYSVNFALDAIKR